MTEKKMGWPQQRFFEFRAGHGTYLAFAVSLVTFVLIVHRLLIERIPELDAIFGDLIVFTLTFAVLYIPIAVLIGRWHMRNQYKVESTMTFMNNPAQLRAFRLLFDLETNSANKEDVEAFKKLLKRLEKETTFSDLSGNLEKDGDN